MFDFCAKERVLFPVRLAAHKAICLLVLLLPYCLLHAQSVEIGDGHSGSWYDPSKDGQGYTLQILSDRDALITWFTYDTQGNQLWMQGLGEISGTTISFPDMFRIEGPKFGDAYDPDDRQIIDTGSLTISFDSCRSGVAEYSGYSELPPETLFLTRLSTVAGFDCGNTQAPVLNGVAHSGLSGAWFDPSQDGQGWMVEILNDELVLVYWFTYDENGKQKWMLGVGQVSENGFIVEEMNQPVGARFGAGFSSDDIIFNDWGSFYMSHIQCQKAVGFYARANDETVGQYRNIVTLATINASDPCDFQGGLRRINGELAASGGSFVDGTTNDPNSNLISNTLVGENQRTGNPVVVTGFASAGPVGFGRFSDEADPFDAYLMPLIAGQSLQLIISDWDPTDRTRNDLDLSLYKEGESEPIAVSASLASNEYISIVESGIYEVVVEAYSGSSVYTLHSSYAPAPASASALSFSGDFIQDEVIVRFKDSAPESKGAYPDRLLAEMDELGLEPESETTIGPMVFKLRSGESEKADTPSDPKGQASSVQRRLYGNASSNGLNGHSRVVKTIKKLLAREDVAYAHPNYIQRTFSDDPFRSSQWHYDAISLDSAWEVTTGSPDVLVAVIDTGVTPHPDLIDNIRYDLGFDAIDRVNNLGPSSRPGDDPSFENRIAPFSHGTHVAGTVAAVSSNNLGGSGVAPSVSIMPIRVLGNGGSIDDIIDGIYWAAGVSRDPLLPDPSRAADVINLSLGGAGPCPLGYQEAIDFAISQGVIVIAAAGNDTTQQPMRPASCAGVVSVSATDRFGFPAPYSNCGQHVDLAAPGGETAPSSSQKTRETWPGSGIYIPRYLPLAPDACRSDPNTSSAPNDGVLSTDASYFGGLVNPGFRFEAGTSMAAPHVAGVAALMKAVNPELDALSFEGLMVENRLSVRPDMQSWDPEFGFGLIDARRAIDAADVSPLPSIIEVTPSFLSFGDTLNTRQIRISSSGGGAGEIQSFDNNNHFWLESAVPIDTDPSGFGVYEIGINRTGFIEGVHRGDFTVRTSTGLERTVLADMRVQSVRVPSDAGFLYLSVFDALTGVEVALLGGAGLNGEYAYEIDGLVPGRYFLITYSDVAFDLGVCTTGNLCGYYPGSGPIQPLRVPVGTDINIPTIAVAPDLSGLSESRSLSLDVEMSVEPSRISSVSQALPHGMSMRRVGLPFTSRQVETLMPSRSMQEIHERASYVD